MALGRLDPREPSVSGEVDTKETVIIHLTLPDIACVCVCVCVCTCTRAQPYVCLSLCVCMVVSGMCRTSRDTAAVWVCEGYVRGVRHQNTEYAAKHKQTEFGILYLSIPAKLDCTLLLY